MLSFTPAPPGPPELPSRRLAKPIGQAHAIGARLSEFTSRWQSACGRAVRPYVYASSALKRMHASAADRVSGQTWIVPAVGVRDERQASVCRPPALGPDGLPAVVTGWGAPQLLQRTGRVVPPSLSREPRETRGLQREYSHDGAECPNGQFQPALPPRKVERIAGARSPRNRANSGQEGTDAAEQAYR